MNTTRGLSSAAVFLVALAARLLYAYESRSNPFFDAPVVDAQAFLEQARRIAGGDLLGGDDAFWQPPLFPYFLAVLQWLFEDSVFLAARVAHALLGAASCLLLYRLALRLLPPLAAAAATIAMALYGPLIYFEGELLAVALEVFLYTALLVLAIKARESESPPWWLAAGLLGGLAAITRPNILLFVLLLAITHAVVSSRSSDKRWRKQLVLFAIGLACAIVPVTWRNAAVGDEFVLVSTNGGVNFYIGNNPRADSTVAIHPGQHWERLMAEPLREGHELPGERSDYFYRRAFAETINAPLTWVGNLAAKTWQLLTGPEIKRNQDPYYARGHSRLLSFLLWDAVVSLPHGLVVPLALLGLVATWRRSDPTLDTVRLFLGSYALSIVLFFVTSRYRTPLAPAWLLFAALGLVWLNERWRAGGWRASAPAVGLILLTGILVNLPAPPPLARDAQLQHDLGEVMLRKEEFGRSLAHSRRATELESDYASAFHNMAVAHLATGQPRLAAAASRQAIDLYPQRPTTRFLHARALWTLGDRGTAVQELETTVRMAPDLREARHELGRWLLRLGRPGEAVEHLEAAHRLQPQAYWATYDLGRAQHQAGRAEDAQATFAHAASLDPSRPEAPSAAGAAALAAGDLAGARRHLQTALQIDESYVPARVNLGLAEIESGNYPAGIDLLEKVLPAAPNAVPLLRALAKGYAATDRSDTARETLGLIQEKSKAGKIGRDRRESQ